MAPLVDTGRSSASVSSSVTGYVLRLRDLMSTLHAPPTIIIPVMPTLCM